MATIATMTDVMRDISAKTKSIPRIFSIIVICLIILLNPTYYPLLWDSFCSLNCRLYSAAYAYQEHEIAKVFSYDLHDLVYRGIVKKISTVQHS